jgi:hypothetical protein
MSGSKSPVYIGAGSSDLAISEARNIIENADTIANHKTTAGRYAQLIGSTVTDADTEVDTTKYSAFEYAQGTTASTGGSAKDYAQKIDGAVSGETDDHSSKAWAVGGDGVTDTALKGASKEWSVESSGTVDGTFFSSKEYAHGTQASTGGSAKDYAQKVNGGVSGATSDHSAKAWSVGGTGITNTASKGAAMEWAAKAENSTVDGTLYSALHYAAKAVDAKDDAVTAKNAAVDAKDDAEAAKTAVDSTFDNFDDRFLGTFTTANEPTTDNDNATLSVGAIYYNSTASQVRFWNGSTWDAPAAAAATSASTATTQAGLAEDAKDDAVLAKTAAETAETNAETAETNAETAETNAEAALATFQSLFHGASTSTPSSNVSDGDLWFDTNTGVNVMKVYNSDTPAWEQLTPTSANQTNINTVVADPLKTNIGLVAAIDGNVTKVADIDGNVTTVAGIGTNGVDVTTVAGRDTEITRLGTSAMSVGATSHLALLGTTAMTNTTDGYLKVLGNATVTADMAILGDTVITDDMALLAIPAVITDMDLLGADGVIGDIEIVSDNISSVNNFADLYQIHTFSPSAPITDGGSNAVAEGDLAYDSTANELKFYDGSAWQVSSGVSLAVAQAEANNAAVAMSIALG